MIFERIGRIFAPKEPELNPPTELSYPPEIPRGRSQVGYSRRGFLGLLGVGAAAAIVVPEVVEATIKYTAGHPEPLKRSVLERVDQTCFKDFERVHAEFVILSIGGRYLKRYVPSPVGS